MQQIWRRQYYPTHRNDDVLSRLLSIGIRVALDRALPPVDNLAKKREDKMGKKPYKMSKKVGQTKMVK